jgi:pullulanase/glycogen debranching enzyme
VRFCTCVPTGRGLFAHADGPEQQAEVSRIAADDAFNWGYDPVHYGVPEGSYATDPDSASRVLEYRQMVKVKACAHLP